MSTVLPARINRFIDPTSLTTDYVVKGLVQRPDGAPQEGYLVQAFDIDLRSQEGLGDAVTGADGSYNIKFTLKAFSKAERGGPDIKLYVYNYKNSDQRLQRLLPNIIQRDASFMSSLLETSVESRPFSAASSNGTFASAANAESPVLESEIHFNCSQETVINLVIGGTILRGKSEYQMLLEAITPVLDGVALQDLVEDEKFQDMTFLSKELEEPAERISYMALAHRSYAETKIPAESFYGLFREKLPTDLAQLFVVPLETIKTALQKASDDNIISEVTQRLLDVPAGEYTTTTLGDILSTVIENPVPIIKLVQQNLPAEEFWNAIDQDPELKPKAAEIKFSLRLGSATLNNAKLIQTISEKYQIRSMADMASFNKRTLLEAISKSGDAMPADIPGDTPEEKRNLYASAILEIVEQEAPTKFLRYRLIDDDDDEVFGNLEEKPEIVSFLKSNSGFELNKMGLPAYLTKNPKALDSIPQEKQEPTRIALETFQKLYSVAPKYSHARTLQASGFRSAESIVRAGRTIFTSMFHSKFDAPGDAARIYENAKQTHAVTAHLFGVHGSILKAPGFSKEHLKQGKGSLAVISSGWSAEAGKRPDMRGLFENSIDTCVCGECRSIVSPAAYLVDLLYFLKHRPIAKNVHWQDSQPVFDFENDNNGVPLDFKRVLFQRRPDIGDIELTCDNTNTALPYSDLVLEILENFIENPPLFPKVGFPVPLSESTALDDEKISDDLRSAFATATGVRLSSYARVRVAVPGRRWNVDELAYTYNLVLDATQGNILVKSQSQQTAGNTGERLAAPQYTHPVVYDQVISSQVYPWNLPLNLAETTVREYGNLVGITIDQIARALDPEYGLLFLNSTKVAFSALKLPAVEVAIISNDNEKIPGNKNEWDFWGFHTAELDSSGLRRIPDPADANGWIDSGSWDDVLLNRVDVFMQQTQLSYVEVLNLVEIWETLSPGAAAKISPNADSVPEDTCDLSLLQITKTDKPVLRKVVSFLRLWRRLKGLSMVDLARLIDVLKPNWSDSISMKEFIRDIWHVLLLQSELGLPLESLSIFWGDISSKVYRSHSDDEEEEEELEKEQSFYSRLFMNNLILKRTNPAYEIFKDPSKLNGSLIEFGPLLAAAFSVGLNEIKIFIGILIENSQQNNLGTGPSFDGSLNLSNLSILYRNILLCESLGIDTSEYRKLLRLVALNPFRSTLDSISFVKTVREIQSSETSISTLSYLLRHDQSTFEQQAALEQNTSTLAQLQATLQAIFADNTYDPTIPDADGALTIKKLGALGAPNVILPHIVEILTDRSGFEATLSAALPEGEPPNIPEEYSTMLFYDPESRKLSYSRVMSDTAKEAILNILPGNEIWSTAVNSIYDEPRKFLKRNLIGFTPVIYSVEFASIPSKQFPPASLKDRVYYTPTDRKLNSVGPLTSAELELLKTIFVSDSEAQEAIANLYKEPDNLALIDPDNVFLSYPEIDGLFERGLENDKVTQPELRFEILLAKALPKLRNKLSDVAISQAMSRVTGLPVPLTTILINTYLKIGTHTINTIFKDENFVTSNANATPAQYEALKLLRKTALICQTLKIDEELLKLIFRSPDQDRVWLTFNQLPLQSQSDGYQLFQAYEYLVQLVKLAGDLKIGSTSNALGDIFNDASSGSLTKDKLVSQLTLAKPQWNKTDLEFLLGTEGFNWVFPPDPEPRQSFVNDHRPILRILEAMSTIFSAGLSSSLAKRLGSSDITEKDAHELVQACKSRYDETSWNTISKQVQDQLRELQRDALIGHLLKNVGPTLEGSWRNTNDLFAYFLIDVEMSPAQLTSRIKQAISSVQLFVQRCILNLEPGIKIFAEADPEWREWSWMKSQVVHAANRQVYLYPENYLVPDLRDDKSSFFVELVDTLRQKELTNDAAEEGFRSYIEKLDRISHIKVIAFYHEEAADQSFNKAIDNFHVFGRTLAEPSSVYYCRREQGISWTPWELVDINITGDHIIATRWSGRLYLFWLIFTEKAVPSEITQLTDTILKPVTFWSINLAWTELKGKKWTPLRKSQSALVIPKSGSNLDESTIQGQTLGNGVKLGKDNVTLRVDYGPEDIYLDIRVMAKSSDVFTGEGGFKGIVKQTARFDATGRSRPSRIATDILGRFRMDQSNGDPIATGVQYVSRPTGLVNKSDPTAMSKLSPPEDKNDRFLNAPYKDPSENLLTVLASRAEIDQFLLPPTGTFIETNGYTEKDDNLAKEVSNLKVNTAKIATFEPSEWLKQQREDTLLAINTGWKAPYTPFKILPPLQDPLFACNRPFFILHGRDTYFVDPHPDQIQHHGVKGGVINDPKLVSDIIGKIKIPELLNEGRFGPINPGDPNPVIRSPFLQVTLGSSRYVAGQAVEINNAQLRSLSATTPALLRNSLESNATPNWLSLKKGAWNGISDWGLRMEKNTLRYYTSGNFSFSSFYHPFIPSFIFKLNTLGIEGLLQRETQKQEIKSYFKDTYNPNLLLAPVENHAKYNVDFEDGVFASYNWELFFHVPIYIADRLTQEQKYEESQRWFHYVFNPTDGTSGEQPAKYWSTKPFYETSTDEYNAQAIPAILDAFSGRQQDSSDPRVIQFLANLDKNVRRWRMDPFKPYLVARTRTVAFQKYVVMKYLDNLIAWGDSLFRRDTIEAINEATQIYVLASEILGPRPSKVGERVKPTPETFNSVEEKIDSFGNFTAQWELFVSPHAPRQPPTDGTSGGVMISSVHESSSAVPLQILYFHAPRNEKLLNYWSTVEDRLFKIRHSMNIDGIVRQLPLWDPPIDPSVVVKAVAAGVSISAVLSDTLSVSQPHYRFNILLSKALDLCGELRSLGSALLVALEKQDGEKLSLIRSRHEKAILAAVRVTKEQYIKEAKEAVQGLIAGREVVVARQLYYGTIPHVTEFENSHIQLERSIMTKQELITDAQLAAKYEALLPDFKASSPLSLGALFGGWNLGMAADLFASHLQRRINRQTKESTMALTLAGWDRRNTDWVFQSGQAALELKNHDSQIKAAEIRQKIAEQELKNHDLQIENANQVEEFLQSKWTNQELYDWSVGQLSDLFFKTYNLAYEAAKKAERVFQIELADQSTNFVKFGYWDSRRKGLLAGEGLAFDLKVMENAYLDRNKREYEIRQSFSLAQMDPVAFLQLRELGECFFSIPEVFFDLEYPGHYLRRLKTVSVTVPCVTGPLTNIPLTLSLISSSVRMSPLTGTRYARADNDIRFKDTYGLTQSIVTSTAQSDNGMFEANLRDDRYLPFENAGAISSWRLTLNKATKRFDHHTITDVVVQLSFTAREGGEKLRADAQTNAKDKALKLISRAEGKKGLSRLFDLKHEFASEWYLFKKSGGATGEKTELEMDFKLGPEKFPMLFRYADIKITRVEVMFMIAKKDAENLKNKLRFAIKKKGEILSDPPGRRDEAVLAPSFGPFDKANAILRGGTNFEIEIDTAELTLWVWLEDATIKSDAIEQIYLLADYMVTNI
ncbi:hypothetical protein ABW20_dc0104863 [Dactylellina cionopaga]|nr:hypothetical protein ABW20_dc0104863 [Dactylellina cionopaga]